MTTAYHCRLSPQLLEGFRRTLWVGVFVTDTAC